MHHFSYKNSNITEKHDSTRFRRFVRSLGRAAGLGDQGIAALEFAAVALPYIAMTLAIFEISILFFEQGVLNYAVSETGRSVRTGQAYNQSPPPVAADIVKAICSKTFLPNCASQLYLNIQDFKSFADVVNATLPPKFPSPSSVTLGVACHIQLIQVFYPWQLLIPINYLFLSTPGYSSSHILSSSVLVENEPFQVTPCTPSLTLGG